MPPTGGTMHMRGMWKLYLSDHSIITGRQQELGSMDAGHLLFNFPDNKKG